MSDIATSLNGASFEGITRVEEMRAQGMITLRGDFADPAFVSAVTGLVEADMPGQRQISTGAERSILWMSPDELMVLCTYAEAPILEAKLRDALADQHALVANVSDARACFELVGGDLREVLAKLAPVDMSPEAFAVGDLRRTRLAQVAGAFWLSSEDKAQVVCFRSVGEYMFNLLKTAAQPGSKVGFL
ncbi:sarcosine oxidase subunit gamma [Tropicibacter sp. R15_0]|uniref:sarcosine oxidase subunit gamma n=1 Tax=Tropicibacter sp. R15_0 TaxID=2821101 RepID=UPI001ADCABB7|nr:sarcosine oxidase subunit gamma family protein [Tropicibacter sp. R15_0]MBO9464979.1 sarcosine oxidase subunit gamma [Tropicibacter sp. R15_0]